MLPLKHFLVIFLAIHILTKAIIIWLNVFLFGQSYATLEVKKWFNILQRCASLQLLTDSTQYASVMAFIQCHKAHIFMTHFQDILNKYGHQKKMMMIFFIT